MKLGWLMMAAALALGGAPARAQEPDYLTPEEVQLVRDAQEPNKRIALFLRFADERLQSFESALAGVPGEKALDGGALKDRLNDFIRAVDDTADALEVALERGGVDLRKTRGPLTKSAQDYLARLQQAGKTERGAAEDLRFDLEDALLASEDLLALSKKIPDAPIPPKRPVVAGQEGKEEQPAEPGRPTLKRKRDEKPK